MFGDTAISFMEFEAVQQFQRLPDDMYLFVYSQFKFLTRIENLNDHYKIGEYIGHGVLGEVRLVTHKLLNHDCAIKIIKKEKIFATQSRIENLENELHVLESVNNQFIAHTYELLHDDYNFYIINELIRQGNMYHYI